MSTARSEVEVLEAVEPERLPQLMALYAAQWWTGHRTAHDVARMLDSSDIVVALRHRPTDRLVGFARVLTDDAYLAVILDVIVAEQFRRRGLGAMLLNVIIGHPRLAAVESLELVCQPELTSFYARWGFTEQVGRSRLMRRTSNPALVSP